jgi:N-acetyl-anhydromuramyl-L-alanine amidase AmpD
MSYSNMVEYVRLSPNCTKPRNKKVNAIVIHHVAGNATVEAVGALFAKPERQASSNYGIGTDGRVACYVEEENRAWTTGSREIDNRAITFEVANCSGAPEWKVSDQALEATIALCVDICRRYGFKLNYTGDKTGNLHMHKWYQNTNCPGPYLESKFPYIAEEVNRRLGGEPPAEKPKESGCTVTLDMLSKGSKGESVKALQILLIGNGYSCGKWGADGDFGAATEEAVRAFQKDNGLDVDGIVGIATWSALLK